MRRIIIGCDHVAVTLKQAILGHLQERGIEVIDAGAETSGVVVDYPDYAHAVAEAVALGKADGGIVLCGTGLGVSMAANRLAGVRAALCHDVFTAHQARAHNNANVLALGAYIVSPERMPAIVDEWLDTPFDHGRHTARLRMLDRDFPPATQPVHPLAGCNGYFSMALSVRETSFSPLVFSGRLEQGIQTLAWAGFHAVEISLRFAEDVQFDHLQSLLQKLNQQISAFPTGQGCIHDQLCLTHPDPFIFKEAVRRLEGIIDLAARFGTDVIIGGVRGKLDGTPAEQARQRQQALDGFCTCDRRAERLGVRLLLEPINRYETNFINNTAEGLAFLDAAGSRTAKLLLDTFHMNIEEVDMPTALALAGDRLGYVHIADSNRQAPGQGHIPFGDIFAALNRLGYSGCISAEILPLPDDESAVQRTANFLITMGAAMARGAVHA